MGRGARPEHRPRRDRTRLAIQDAITDVQHATRPQSRSAGAVFSWLLALAAGATVAWRGLQKAAEIGQETDDSAEADAQAERLRRARSAAGESGTQAASRPAQNGTATARRDRAVPVARPGEGETCPPAGRAKVSGGWLALAKEFTARFTQDETPLRAQALAFTGILSLVPLLLFALAALGFLVRDPQQAADYVRQFVANLLPGEQASRAADQVIQQTNVIASAQTLISGRWWAMLFGLLSLLWAGLSLLVTASASMNAAWEVEETRGFLKLHLICLGVFAASGLFFVLSLLPSSGPDMVQRLHIPGLGLPRHPPFWLATLLQLLFEAVAWCIDIALFVVIYRFLPNAPVTWRAALFGGAVAGFFWELFKKGFTVYLANFGDFNKLYGALGGIVLLMTWILYSCIVLLAGAILCKMVHEHREEGGVGCRSGQTPGRAA